jgi:predicted NAD/FAD-binding protein
MQGLEARSGMRLAVVGSGVSGLVAAWLLSRRHHVVLFEAEGRLGGHVNTVDVRRQDGDWAIDTGFIVFNDRTYPSFVELLDQLGVASQPSTMSFSVQCEQTGLEYGGTNLNTLFAQRRNLLRPSFHRMLRDILRFNARAPRLLEDPDDALTLGAYLERERYSSVFVEHYLIPMGAAIWSADPRDMREFPAAWFVRFFANHGMLSIDDRPTWRVIRGGSQRYVERIAADLRGCIRLRTPVLGVRRQPDGVLLRTPSGTERFDGVVIAAHSDQALRMLEDPSAEEGAILSAIPYRANEAVLHTDASLLPRRRHAWSAWNYHVREQGEGVAITYGMNILQGLRAQEQFCVTLNHADRIDPQRAIRTIDYAHPLFTRQGAAAQRRHTEINGARRTWYCGAYWGNGFHEDGVRSALAVTRQFGLDLRDRTARRGVA